MNFYRVVNCQVVVCKSIGTLIAPTPSATRGAKIYEFKNVSFKTPGFNGLP